MAENTGDNLDIVVNIVAKADKQAAVQETTKVINTVVKQFDTLSRKDIGKKLLRTFTKSGNVSRTIFNELFRDVQTGKYFQQVWKRGWTKIVDASGKERKKEKFYALGKPKEISQEEAWRLGGLDPSVISLQIEEAKQAEKNERLAKEQARLARQTAAEEAKKDAKKHRFLETFKRIGFYRIVRGIFAGIRNIFVQGIQGLADFDKGANQTVSELLTGYEKLKASIAITIMPLLEAIAPAVTSITNEIADFANNISKASAASKGLTEYTKISDKYVKNMATNSQKLLASFDKFDSLNAKDSPYEKAGMTPEEAKQAVNNTAFQFMEQFRIVGQFIFSLINTLWESIKAIWKGIEPFSGRILKYLNKFSEIIADVVVKVVELSVKFLDFIDSTIGIENFIWGIVSALAIIKSYKLISSMTTLIDKFGKISTLMSGLSFAVTAIAGILAYNIFSELMKNMNDTDKTIGIIIGGIVALIASIYALQHAMAGDWVGAISGAAATAIGIGVMIAGIRAKTYANGGIPDRGSLFIAGESGAELVTTMSGGRTGVSNTEQLREAVYGALSDWWSTAQYDIPEQQATYIDTAEIARSKRFKSELNRTNPNLNLV